MSRSTQEQIDARRARYPLGFGTPEKVAGVIDFFLGDDSAWITGQCLVADGGHQLT
jgi:NAD(P)-dependent dehydrogenase (short-subunit alcohol dehydrogenase family)